MESSWQLAFTPIITLSISDAYGNDTEIASTYAVVYDNKLGSDYAGYDTQELGGGSIQIHKGGNKNPQKFFSYNINDRLISGINAFPNPAIDILNVQLKGDFIDENIYMFNQLGQMVWQDKLPGSEGFTEIKLISKWKRFSFYLV